MDSKVTNILIVGVGGQGTLLASKVIGTAALNYGLDVKQSEVHGMAQRGGSVVTFVRFGEKVYSPLVEAGQADVILAFEKLEALRWSSYLKPGGTIIVNTQEIAPLPVIIGAQSYPERIVETLRNMQIEVVAADALSMAKAAGNARALNVVLMGILANYLSFSKEDWHTALRAVVPGKVIDVNLAAFEAGFNFPVK
ncbi:MAG TPA: indolepyruvate oxidoreductase subunit beta [Negativicutes bacterium]|nr:indolepyruvate oxidoreductase subunit beta [Negativicutes bacterium]